MKRLFRIGFGMFIFSFIPVLLWIILSYVLGDSRISNVFSITYAIQFVYSIIVAFFGSGANIRQEKEKDANSAYNGIFWGTIFSIIIFSVPLIFVDEYIAFFGQDVAFYKPYVIFSIVLLFVQTLFELVIQKLYFEDNEKLANIHLITFNLCTLGLTIILSWSIPRIEIALLITIIVLLIYVISLYIWKIKKFKIDFKFYKNFRYESGNIIVYLFFMFIYLFGLKNAFSAGEEYVIALNLVALCTDSQWDSLYAISTVAKVDISKDRYNYKKEIRSAYIYTCIVMLSSILMTVCLGCINELNMAIVLIYLMFQIMDMLFDPFLSIMENFIQINYSPTLNTTIKFSALVVRTIISVFLLSPYCTNIGQIVESVILITAFVIVRLKKFKLKDGRLEIVPTKTQKEIQK